MSTSPEFVMNEHRAHCAWISRESMPAWTRRIWLGRNPTEVLHSALILKKLTNFNEEAEYVSMTGRISQSTVKPSSSGTVASRCHGWRCSGSLFSILRRAGKRSEILYTCITRLHIRTVSRGRQCDSSGAKCPHLSVVELLMYCMKSYSGYGQAPAAHSTSEFRDFFLFLDARPHPETGSIS
ncbi:hypothetical protein BDZ97DRAFT_1782377 [Flammula alnicola]|nr:hypothetical protein BDZ97DRAFT_1782377 [Flammula alnicola]